MVAVGVSSEVLVRRSAASHALKVMARATSQSARSRPTSRAYLNVCVIMRVSSHHVSVKVIPGSQARGQRMARPTRRLIEADFSPGVDRQVVCRSLLCCLTYGSAETMGLVVQGAME